MNESFDYHQKVVESNTVRDLYEPRSCHVFDLSKLILGKHEQSCAYLHFLLLSHLRCVFKLQVEVATCDEAYVFVCFPAVNEKIVYSLGEILMFRSVFVQHLQL